MFIISTRFLCWMLYHILISTICVMLQYELESIRGEYRFWFFISEPRLAISFPVKWLKILSSISAVCSSTMTIPAILPIGWQEGSCWQPIEFICWPMIERKSSEPARRWERFIFWRFLAFLGVVLVVVVVHAHVYALVLVLILILVLVPDAGSW